MATRTTEGRRHARGTVDLPERLWSAQETAAFLGVSVKRLWRLNHEGTGPRYSRVGRICRYDPRDVQEYLQANASDAARLPEGA